MTNKKEAIDKTITSFKKDIDKTRILQKANQ